MKNITFPKNLNGLSSIVWENDKNLILGTVLQNINRPLANHARMQFVGRKRSIEVKLRLKNDDWYEQKNILLTEKNNLDEYLGTPIAVWLLSLLETPLYEIQQDAQLIQGFDESTMQMFLREFSERLRGGNHSREIENEQIHRLFASSHFTFDSLEKALETEEGAKKLFEQDIPNSLFNFVFDLQERRIYFEWIKSKLKSFEIPIEQLKSLDVPINEIKVKDSKPKIKWRGTQIDLIRLLIALNDSRKFELTDDSKLAPSQELMMQEFGKFLGLDLSNHEQELSNSMDRSLEANVKFFENLKTKIQKRYIKKTESN